MNLKEEAERIKNNTDWFNATMGMHRIVLTSEPEERTSTFENETHIQYVFDIETKQGRMKWSVTRGETKSSLWGQLVLLAETNNYKFTGLALRLTVVGEGRHKRYSVELMDELPL